MHNINVTIIYITTKPPTCFIVHRIITHKHYVYILPDGYPVKI
jgi:hypothetical protein